MNDASLSSYWPRGRPARLWIVKGMTTGGLLSTNGAHARGDQMIAHAILHEFLESEQY
jgi:hypothetical protein